MGKKQRFGYNAFQVGDKILTQNLKSKKWEIPGEIIQLIESDDQESRPFALRTNDNEILWRNSRYIRLDLTKPDQTQVLDSLTKYNVNTIINYK